jgi:heat shock protein HslJ
VTTDDLETGTIGSSPVLVGTWQTETLGGIALEEGVASSVTFTRDGRVGGHGGVNRFGGTYAVRGDELEFGALFSTRTAGPEPAMIHETALRAALQGTRHFALADDTLTIGAGPDEVRLRRLADVPASEGAA